MDSVEEPKGIVDFDEKSAAIFKILDGKWAVLANRYRPKSQSNLADIARKWKDHDPRPGESTEFIKSILSALQCKHLTVEGFVKCAYEEFLDAMPLTHRRTLQPTRNHGSHIVYRSPFPGLIDKPDEWLNLGKIDQHFMYLNLDDVARWVEVVRDEDYEVYLNCKDSLAQALSSETLSEMLGGNKLKNIIILGTGATSKEIQILKLLERHQNDCLASNVQVILIDFSYYMLTQSYDSLLSYTKRPTGASRYQLHQFNVDFTKLGSVRSEIKQITGSQDGSSIYFLLGGTLGNINELEFADSINKVANPRDLFVINIETHNGEDAKTVKKKLKQSYSSASAKDLVLGPAHRLLDRERIPRDPEIRRKMVEVDVWEKGQVPSAVNNTLGVVLGIKIGDKALNLSLSKKYDLGELSAFFDARGFERLPHVFSSQEQANHHQIILQKR